MGSTANKSIDQIEQSFSVTLEIQIEKLSAVVFESSFVVLDKFLIEDIVYFYE